MGRRTLVSIMVCFGAVSATPLAQAQEEPMSVTDPEPEGSTEPDGGVGILSAYTYLTGTTSDETIVYGDIIEWSAVVGPPCTGSVYTNLGKGICIFYFDSGGTHGRGSYVSRSLWNPAWGSPMGIKGDTSGGTSADWIYASDEFGEASVGCGSGHWVDTYGDWIGTCGSATANFNGVMEIHGDDGSTSSGGGDQVWGWDNGDTLYGNGGADYLWAGGGADTVYGQDGDDPDVNAETCTSGTETLSGGAGADSLYGSDTTGCTDMILGDSGNDSLEGFAGNDTLKGNYGNDTISGGWGNDILYGYQNDDTLNGWYGDDTLYGGTGTDTCDGSYGSDACDTGSSGCDSRSNCESIP